MIRYFRKTPFSRITIGLDDRYPVLNTDSLFVFVVSFLLLIFGRGDVIRSTAAHKHHSPLLILSVFMNLDKIIRDARTTSGVRSHDLARCQMPRCQRPQKLNHLCSAHLTDWESLFKYQRRTVVTLYAPNALQLTLAARSLR